VVGFGSGPGPLPLAPFISLLFKWATVFLFKNSFLLNIFDFIATSAIKLGQLILFTNTTINDAERTGRAAYA
jgi:hypothetical protein